MSKFFVPKRYDQNRAEQGVTFPVVDEADTYWGDFTLRHLDEFSQRGEREYKRIRQKYASQLRAKKLTDYDAIKVVLCEAALIAWKLPSDPNDKKAEPVPFTVENAIEMFSMDEFKWLCIHLSRLASDITNYQPDAGETPEKN